MKQLSVIVIAFCTFATFCKWEDPIPVEKWLGPRLSDDTRVAAPRKPADECGEVPATHAEARQALANDPSCTDEAIASLEMLASANTVVDADLAAAYYVRAVRDDQPLDLPRALNAASKVTPPSPQSLFNRALAQQSLGLFGAAAASWDELLKIERGPQWTIEARQHRNTVQVELDRDGAADWQVITSRLSRPLRAKDVRETQSLIGNYPGSASAYFEEELLGRWAEEPTREHLDDARTLAAALSSRLGGDLFNVRVVEAIDAAASNPARLRALREGHRELREARAAQKSFRPGSAAARYQRAAERLDAGGSPLALQAHLGYAVMSDDPVLPLLDRIESRASAEGWKHLLARVAASRAFLLAYLSRHVESLAESDRGLAAYERLADRESAANLQSRRIGYLRILGQRERAWRLAVTHVRGANRIVALRDRHNLLGEAAEAALELGHTEVASGYMSDAIALIRRRRAEADQSMKAAADHNLGIALRKLAKLEIRAGDEAAARRHLEEAIRLRPDRADLDDRRVLDAHIEEVHGQTLLRTRPDQAVAAFSRALAAADDELRSFRAALFVQRAEAHERLHHAAEAERDLAAAVDELRLEETENLARRKPGESEHLWSLYFSRSQETYQRLIRHYVEHQRPADAFHYAERARAFEPLNLLLQSTTVPSEFRALTAGGNSIALTEIRKRLPAGTFLIAYSVQRDRTYVWIVSRDGFEQLIQPAGSADVELWSDSLQRAAVAGPNRTFETGLEEPYKILIEDALATATRMNGGRAPARLVFVPDAAMHGLPLAALKDVKTGRHLIEVAPVEIAGSATLYVYSLLRKRELSKNKSVSAFLIGDPEVEKNLALALGVTPGRLTGAEREVDQIKAMYEPHARMWKGAEATVPVFLTEAPQYSIVHIAAHAVANPREPWKSTLLLAASAGESGALSAEQLLKRMKLTQTSLVVLAACSSAGGVPVGPEGLAPLVRPFLTSGVPAVVGSLWNVNDATVEPLLVSFHRYYRPGGDAAIALQRAQRELLGNKTTRRQTTALTWAAFQVIGH